MFTLTVPSPHSLNNLSSLIRDLVATVALKWIHSHYYSCCCVIAFITTILAQWAFALNVFMCASVHSMCVCVSVRYCKRKTSHFLFSLEISIQTGHRRGFHITRVVLWNLAFLASCFCDSPQWYLNSQSYSVNTVSPTNDAESKISIDI